MRLPDRLRVFVICLALVVMMQMEVGRTRTEKFVFLILAGLLGWCAGDGRP